MKKQLLFLLILCSSLGAIAEEKIDLICSGLVLLGNHAPLLSKQDLRSFQKRPRVECYSLNKDIHPKALSKMLGGKFARQPLNEDFLQRLRTEIALYYESEHHPFVEVIIPHQDISSGVVQVRIKESSIGLVEVQGGKHTSPKLLKDYLDVSKGEILDEQQLRKNVAFMNRNPFRRVDLIYAPGQEELTTDLTLEVEDRRPVRFYVGADNTGVETTERTRLSAGFNYAKVFNLDHFFTYQYTTAPNLHNFQAHTIQYLMFLPWRNVFNLYGGYSSLHAHLPFPNSKNHGQSVQASGRYTIPFDPLQKFYHEMTIGFDFKRMNNNAQYSEVYANFSNNVNLSEFVLAYAGNYTNSTIRCRLDVDGQLFFSPGAILSDETNTLYNGLRPGAKNHWLYGKAMVKYFQTLPHSWSLLFCARGQLSSQNLLPSEQLGLGGYETVRGYDENQLNYDSGAILNVEWYTPSFSIFGKKRRDAFQFLAFVDYGYGRNRHPIPNEKKSDYLLGAGPGIRYTWNPWLSARIDVGFKLHDESIFTGGNPMWHAALNMNF